MSSGFLDARRVCVLLVVVLVLAVLLVPLFSSQVKAATSYVNIPGVSCAAYNNTQADFLERSHVRIYNPITSPTGIYVVCGVPRIVQFITSSANKLSGWVNIYFDYSVPLGTEVSCGIREYDFEALDTPGGAGTSAFYNGITAIAKKTAATGTAQLVDSAYAFTLDETSTCNYWTVTCDLKPGTGVNSIDAYEQ